MVGLFLLTVLAGCGGDVPEGALTGRIQIGGSSTVYPLTEAVAEEFMEEYPGVRITVGVSGTGGGFAKFTRGTLDINNASRPIQPVEARRAEEAGIDFIEVPVAYDGIAVVVNPANDWVECLTVEELRQIWQPDSDVETWSDIRPSFPDRPIHLYGPGTDSGTYDYFTTVVVGETAASRTDFTASEDDFVLVQGVAGDPNALGYVGLAYYENNQDQLELLGIDSGEGCVKPTVETVSEGTYQPLARPEFIYINATRADDPAIQAFVEFYLENAARLARQVGYVPLSEAGYALAEQRFEQQITGSLYDGEELGTRVEDLMRAAQPALADTTVGAPADTTAAGAQQ